MIPIKEFVKRSLVGPFKSPKDFDLHLSRTLRALVSDYNIHFKHEEFICDDATADAIFQAAVDLLSQVGIYNKDTSRVILLGRDELLEVARETPDEWTVGGGEDAVTVKWRAHDNKTAPTILPMPVTSYRYGGKQATFIDMTAAYSSEQSGLGGLARSLLKELEGIGNLADTPGEIMWCRVIYKWVRAIAKAMGKPDVYLGPVIGISVPAVLACYSPGLLEKHNCYIPMLLEPELKLDWGPLKLAYVAEEMQIPAYIGTGVMLGVYCRTGEEAAVAIVASLLAQLSYTHGVTAHLGSNDREGNRTSRAVLQSRNAAFRAAERNIGNPLGCAYLVPSGLGTVKSIYEEAALVLSETCSGISWMWGFPLHPGSNGEPKVDLDCKLASKISRGVAGLGREEVSELLRKILAVYEPNWGVREEGKPYNYYYDWKTLTPTQELVDLYKREEENLSRLGVPMEDGPFS